MGDAEKGQWMVGTHQTAIRERGWRERKERKHWGDKEEGRGTQGRGGIQERTERRAGEGTQRECRGVCVEEERAGREQGEQDLSGRGSRREKVFQRQNLGQM